LWSVGPACALLLLAADVGTARAAWCNVFQVCCNSCRNQPVVANYGPDPCCAPPPPVCTTRYVQRCYYCPVTTYQTRSYYQQVTTYRTSYYYEPVTSYRYSCYVDPCTGCTTQVACPQTCYKLRSQCCPVQSWVQRCCQVPVQSYRIASYWEPVTTCCQPQAPCCPTAGVAVPGVNVSPAPAGQPGVSEQRLQPTPGVQVVPDRSSGTPLYDNRFPSNSGSATNPSNLRPTLLPPIPPPAPSVRLDRIVSIPQSQVQGQLVRNDNAPRSGAQLTFVSTDAQAARRQVTTDAAGKFNVTLASGGWLVYIDDTDKQPIFQTRLTLGDNENRQITLVSR
jgi:hypothetical protein